MTRRERHPETERRVDQSKRKLVERLRTDEALNVSSEQFISFFDTIDEKVYVADPVTHEILYANPALKKLFGEKVLGEKCYKVMQDLNEPCDFCTNPLIFGENLGKTHIWEFQNRKIDKWRRCIDKAIRWGDGRMVRFEMAIDIHDRKVAEEALRKSEEKYRYLVENIPEVIYTTDRDGIVTYVSPAIERLTGFAPSDMVGRHFSEFIFKEDLGYLESRYDHALEGQRSPTEYRVLTKSGGYRWVSTFSRPIKEDNKSIGLQGVLSDVTAYKEAEAGLREREKELKVKTVNLEEMNAALRVLLRRMEEDRRELEDKARLNIQQIIQPYLEKLRAGGLTERQRKHLETLEANLQEILSPFTHKLLVDYPRLTPSELHIANLIRQGKSSKEIADDLGLSLRTVETHRRNMRNKLGIKDKKTNLRSYLLSNQNT